MKCGLILRTKKDLKLVHILMSSIMGDTDDADDIGEQEASVIIDTSGMSNTLTPVRTFPRLKQSPSQQIVSLLPVNVSNPSMEERLKKIRSLESQLGMNSSSHGHSRVGSRDFQSGGNSRVGSRDIQAGGRISHHVSPVMMSQRFGDRVEYTSPALPHRRVGVVPDEQTDQLINVLDFEEQIAQHDSEIQFRRSTFWKACCGQVIDKRATQFFVQVGMSASVMIFCMYKISVSKLLECTGEDTTVYFSLISAIIGWFLPSPSFA